MFHKLCKLLLVFVLLKLSYTSDILLYSKYEVYFEYTFLDIFDFQSLQLYENNWENDLYLSIMLWIHKEFGGEIYFSILWTCFWYAFVSLFRLRSKLGVYFGNLCIYCQTQKYTCIRLAKLMNLYFDLILYLKYIFWIWCVCFQTQKITWSGLSNFMY